MHFIEYFANFFRIMFIPMGICFIVGFWEIRQIKTSPAVRFFYFAGLFAILWRLFVISPGKRYELFPAFFLLVPAVLGLYFIARKLTDILSKKYNMKFINIFTFLFILICGASIAKGLSFRNDKPYLREAGVIIKKQLAATPDARILYIDYWDDTRVEFYSGSDFDTFTCNGESKSWKDHALFLMLQKGRFNYDRIFISLTAKKLKHLIDNYTLDGVNNVLKELGSWQYKKEKLLLCEYNFAAATDRTSPTLTAFDKNPLQVVSLPSIDLALNRKFELFYDNIMAGRKTANCVVEVNSPFGKQMKDCWSYTPKQEDKPKSFDLEIIVKDNAGWHIGRFLTRVNVRNLEKPMPEEILVLSLMAKPSFADSLALDLGKRGKIYVEEDKALKKNNAEWFPVRFSHFKDYGNHPPKVVFVSVSQRILRFASSYAISKQLELIDKTVKFLKGKYPDSAIAICLPWISGISQDFFGDKYGCEIRRWDYQRARQRIVNHLVKEYGQKENDKVFLLPTNLILDQDKDFSEKSLRVNSRGAGKIADYLLDWVDMYSYKNQSGKN